MSPSLAASSNLLPLPLEPRLFSGTAALLNFHQTRAYSSSGFKCLAGKPGFFTRLGRLIQEKAKSDAEKIFSGFSKTRDNLAVVDELLLYWNLSDTDRVLDELEEALLVADFGPRITVKILESLREDIYAGKLKSGSEIKDALKRNVLDVLTSKGLKTELQLGFRKPGVIMIVGVNGGGKTTSLGKLANRLKQEGTKVLLAAGDTFRAAASDQLEIWAERTGCEIIVAEKENAKASSVLSQAVKRGREQGFDVVLCDTSGRLHTNYSLMEELIACKKAIGKVVSEAPNEILQVLDGTTGLNMLPQAREFNDVVGVTGLILTKLDGSARGGCVVSVVDELGIPVKFVGVGEGVEDLQPFDPQAFEGSLFILTRMARGTLEVLLVGAKGLEDSDFLGGVDPYAILTFRTQEKKSSVASGQGSSPEWNETFLFTVSGGVTELKIKIMDKDTFTSDDFLGEATIPLEAVFEEEEIPPVSYSVVKDEEYCGEIKVGLRFTCQRDDECDESGFGEEEERYGGWRESSSME